MVFSYINSIFYIYVTIYYIIQLFKFGPTVGTNVFFENIIETYKILISSIDIIFSYITNNPTGTLILKITEIFNSFFNHSSNKTPMTDINIISWVEQIQNSILLFMLIYAIYPIYKYYKFIKNTVVNMYDGVKATVTNIYKFFIETIPTWFTESLPTYMYKAFLGLCCFIKGGYDILIDVGLSTVHLIEFILEAVYIITSDAVFGGIGLLTKMLIELDNTFNGIFSGFVSKVFKASYSPIKDFYINLVNKDKKAEKSETENQQQPNTNQAVNINQTQDTEVDLIILDSSQTEPLQNDYYYTHVEESNSTLGEQTSSEEDSDFSISQVEYTPLSERNIPVIEDTNTAHHQERALINEMINQNPTVNSFQIMDNIELDEDPLVNNITPTIIQNINDEMIQNTNEDIIQNTNEGILNNEIKPAVVENNADVIMYNNAEFSMYTDTTQLYETMRSRREKMATSTKEEYYSTQEEYYSTQKEDNKIPNLDIVNSYSFSAYVKSNNTSPQALSPISPNMALKSPLKPLSQDILNNIQNLRGEKVKKIVEEIETKKINYNTPEKQHNLNFAEPMQATTVPKEWIDKKKREAKIEKEYINHGATMTGGEPTGNRHEIE